jgi:hypothetical protein
MVVLARAAWMLLCGRRSDQPFRAFGRLVNIIEELSTVRSLIDAPKPCPHEDKPASITRAMTLARSSAGQPGVDALSPLTPWRDATPEGRWGPDTCPCHVHSNDR